jgi:hypothetical protein
VIEWFTLTVVTVSVIAGLIQAVEGVRGQPPRDVTLLASAAVVLLLVVQVALAIAAPLWGNGINGDPLEFWMYLFTAIAMTPLAAVFALVDRTRIGTFALAGVSLATAVMAVRMADIWSGV